MARTSDKKGETSMITYGKRTELNTIDVIRLFESSGIVRPFSQPSRIKEMILNSDLIYTAWNEDQLIGIARCVTDFSYCCYLSDLAVHRDYQSRKVGATLIEHVEKELGDEVSLIWFCCKVSILSTKVPF